jgi:hypothetical protein
MSLPMSTTTIAVLRMPADPERDPVEDFGMTPTTIATGVRAHISTSRGFENTSVGAQQSVVMFRLACDPTDLAHTDRVKDEKTGEEYEVLWTRSRQELGMGHVEAGLKQVEGNVS